MLKRNHIVNAVIFVIRYFGGTKLGLPRLKTAYKTAADDAIKTSVLQPWTELRYILLEYNYNIEKSVEFIINKNKAHIIVQSYSDKIYSKIEIDSRFIINFIKQLTDISSDELFIHCET